MSPNQYGFVPGKSTVDTISELIAEGAFDNMWWPGLLKYLHDIGFSAQILALVKDYLKGRSITHSTNLTLTVKNLTKCCPQSFALGPSLWNLTVESLLRSPRDDGVSLVAYADDIVCIKANNSRQLNHDALTRNVYLSKLGKYSKVNGENIHQSHLAHHWIRVSLLVQQALPKPPKRILTSVQATCLRMITGVYRSTPNETVCLLAKKLPLNIELRKAVAIKQLKATGTSDALGEILQAAVSAIGLLLNSK
ncbi:hypothetical protein JTB14_022699 [Gonioctena quinquepunctata]|nr:hypothetical protein JTB14_022699 [Gonioctena quinquepunctata]